MFRINSYFVDIAKKIGILPSILLTYIDSIKREDDGRIIQSREDIFNNIGMSSKEQEDSEICLSSFGIMESVKFKGNPQKLYYSINEKQLQNILDSEDVSEVCGDDIFMQLCPTPPKKEANKRDKSISSLKETAVRYCSGKCSDVLSQYLCDWVDSVYANPKGFLTSQSIKCNIDDLFSFTDSEDIRIEIIRIAIKNGHRDIKWSIDSYEKDKSKKHIDMDIFGSYDSLRAKEEDSSSEVF